MADRAIPERVFVGGLYRLPDETMCIPLPVARDGRFDGVAFVREDLVESQLKAATSSALVTVAKAREEGARDALDKVLTWLRSEEAARVARYERELWGRGGEDRESFATAADVIANGEHVPEMKAAEQSTGGDRLSALSGQDSAAGNPVLAFAEWATSLSQAEEESVSPRPVRRDFITGLEEAGARPALTEALKAENAAPVHSWAQSEGHAYVSTACHHEQHARCRLICKFCPAKCGCACHFAIAIGSVKP